jgi:hypothetical protein
VEALTEIMDSLACTLCKEKRPRNVEQAMWTNHELLFCKRDSNQYVDSFSAFMDNTKKLKTPLDNIVLENNVGTVYIMDIATDYCVYHSNLDALTLGFAVYLVVDASLGIAQETADAALADMEAKGATIINSTDIFEKECPSGAVFTAIARTVHGTPRSYFLYLRFNSVRVSSMLSFVDVLSLFHFISKP